VEGGVILEVLGELLRGRWPDPEVKYWRCRECGKTEAAVGQPRWVKLSSSLFGSAYIHEKWEKERKVIDGVDYGSAGYEFCGGVDIGKKV
jgi:hypothetical protein